MRLAPTFAIVGLALALAPAAAVAATATHGMTTANVNFRTGPDTQFPAVTVIPYGAPVVILGCLEDRSWCDVVYYGERGWVHAAYLQSQAGRGYGQPPEAVYGAPVVGFNVDLYWNEHYRGRPWYRDRGRFNGPRWRNRPGWNRPDWQRWQNDWQQPTYNSWHQNDRDRNRQGWNGNDQQWSNDQQQWDRDNRHESQYGQTARNNSGNQAQAGGNDEPVIYYDAQAGNGGRGGNRGSTSWRGNPTNPEGQAIRECLDAGRSWDECRPDR